ncbi:MAG: type IV secretory system conjugative DNA transfer family protein [Rhodobacteraceae bacterium]|nr:type IV secretory system conjugative DNA transfer family protein [Paracoccaceae bacterium]
MTPSRLFILSLLLSGCLGQTVPLAPPPTPAAVSTLPHIGGRANPGPAPLQFADLRIPTAPPEPKPADFRIKRMRDAALSWGAQHGQARRSWELASGYATRAHELNTVWDFSRVAIPAPMSTGWVLPPIVLRAGAAWTGDDREAEAASEYYEILRPARIAPRLPSWQDYLPLPSAPPTDPSITTLPQPGEEQQWREWAAKGWDAGIRLAEVEHAESLARLERDFTGMMEYRRLIALGMVSDMVVEADHWPAAVGEDGTVLRIGGRRLSITRDAEFVDSPDNWRPRIVVTARQG